MDQFALDRVGSAVGEEDTDVINDLSQSNGQEAEASIRFRTVDEDRGSRPDDAHAREGDLTEVRFQKLALPRIKAGGRE